MTAADRGAPRTAAHLPLAELALAVVSTSVVFGFSRILQGWSFLGELMAMVAYAHLVSLATRRRGWSVPAAAIVTVAGWALLATWLWFPDTIRLGLPSLATWRAAHVEMASSWEAFRELSAPAPAHTGFLLAASGALVFAIFLADWAAFRLWSPIEALVPLTTLFVFCTLLAADQQRLSSAAFFVGSALGFVLAHRVARLEQAQGWLASQADEGSRSLLRVGGLLCSVAVLGGVILGPRLPGAGNEALVDWRGTETGPSSRVTVSPLVDIKARLVDQTDQEVFTVDSPQKAYWRLTALDTFDGTIWRSGGKYGQAKGDLGPGDPPPTGTPVRQHFTITGLRALWLPAAFEPVAIDAGAASVRYQQESSTLIVDTDHIDSDGLEYTVTSVIPSFGAQELSGAAAADVPQQILEHYASPPLGLSSRAQKLARQIVSRSGGRPYDEALALQQYFRTNFDYDLHVDAGHGDNAIDDFLTRRRGYCEQFAGTFAALARSLGIPARVAVGFTWGEQDPDNPDHYVVRGRHAHAWPEVYLAGFGWVPFEPTPDRGMPGAASWTGVNASQDTARGATASTSSTTTTAVAAPTSTTGSTLPGAEGAQPLVTEKATRATTSGGSRAWWQNPLFVLLVAALAAMAIYAAVVPLASHRHRRRRRARARADNSARVRVAWQESAENLAMVGAARRPEETHVEFAGRAGGFVPEHATMLAELARDTDTATFAVGVLDDDVVERSESTASAVAETVRIHTPLMRRIVHHLDPRPLVSGSRRRPDGTAQR